MIRIEKNDWFWNNQTLGFIDPWIWNAIEEEKIYIGQNVCYGDLCLVLSQQPLVMASIDASNLGGFLRAVCKQGMVTLMQTPFYKGYDTSTFRDFCHDLAESIFSRLKAEIERDGSQELLRLASEDRDVVRLQCAVSPLETPQDHGYVDWVSLARENDRRDLRLLMEKFKTKQKYSFHAQA